MRIDRTVKPLLAAAVICILVMVNACNAQELQEVRHRGCVCPKLFRPVCGSDGWTYSNGCEAHCRGVPSWCNGECPCPEEPSGGIPPGFDPCDCCRGRVVIQGGLVSVGRPPRPAVCDRLADFDCRFC